MFMMRVLSGLIKRYKDCIIPNPTLRFATNEFTLDQDKIKDNRIHVTNFDVNKVKEVLIIHVE